MKAMSVMRFVVLGAVGFGIGWALAGLLNSGFTAIYDPSLDTLEPGRGVDLPPWWVRGLSRFSWLSWFIAGACGGAGLGLALGSWKRVGALAGAGALGFGLGNALLFAFSLLFFFPLLVPVSLWMGALGGLMLGVALADWRRAVLLGLAGMVGFGVGGAFAAELGMYVRGIDVGPPPYRPVPYVLGLGMVGLIGGASLGAALGYSEYRKLAAQRRPWVQMNLRGTWERVGLRPWMLALLIVGIAVVLVGGVLIGAVLGGVCTDEERNVYAEFPQYGSINKEPQPDAESGACVVIYDTRASQEQVAQYYAQQLKAHGWTVQLTKGKATASLPAENTKITVEQFNVNAQRDNFSYDVSFESHEMYDPPRRGAHVAVHVGKDSGKSPPSE
jgi:hypothetical protein